ncbi:MAG: chemotaxis protein CheW [Pseudazoarcus pumilus]|nr:chemotaxis protein CheW [Pseudazoarcus pumilus]
MKRRQSARSAADLGYLARFMSGLHEDQRKLREIQSVYDNLTLLGQLLCAGTDITGMRSDFNDLAAELLDQLARESRKKAVRSLGSDARVAIDILVRNLFERTADIGFLATDEDVRAFAESVMSDPHLARDRGRVATLVERFDEYVKKYSVYHNIMLLSPDGKVLAQLDRDNDVHESSDPLIRQALKTSEPYVEVFRKTDLLPDEDTALIYAYRVMSADGHRPVGVLCLCFRFEDECRRIFDGLLGEDDWTVITLLDGDDRVIASSDPYQVPVGARLERAAGEDASIVRFAGREYLATTRESHGYQGYMGPGWVGHALAPLNHVFEMAVAHELEAVPQRLREGVLETTTLFSQALRDIPVRATTIQRELNRAVWNGTLWLTRDAHALNGSFAKVLLWEIGSTGVRTREVFSESTTNLYETVVSSVLYDCSAQAALAMDIMDRNLYERANDCRWWALTGAFRELLAQHRPLEVSERERLTDILRTINGLYTVYSNLIVFDSSARIVAVSNPAYARTVGETLSADWVRETLALPDTQSYCVSSFAPSPMYGNQATYIYSAAIRAPGADGEPVGGIAIVFDSTPQFIAMLQDALPRNEDGSAVDGAIAAFSERDGRIIASTDEGLPIGSKLEIGREFFDLDNGESCANVVELNGRYYAVGSRMSSGYREYKSEDDAYRNDIVALVLVPLSDRLASASAGGRKKAATSQYATRPARADDTLEIATFYIGSSWYGVRAEHVIEATDRTSITPVPGMPEWVRGCVMYDDHPISVFDLSPLLPGRPSLRGEGQVVVVGMPEQNLRFGILVDELGDIPEIPVERIDPVPAMLGQSGSSMTDSLVRPDASVPGGEILVVLSLEAIMRRLASAEQKGGADVELLPSSPRARQVAFAERRGN